MNVKKLFTSACQVDLNIKKLDEAEQIIFQRQFGEF